MGIKITTDEKAVKVYRNDTENGYSFYSIRFSKKEGDSWVSAFQPVRFRKGVKLQNEQEICIKDAFPTIDSWTKGDKQFTRVVWQILEFDSNAPYIAAEPDDDEYEGYSAVEDSVPF